MRAPLTVRISDGVRDQQATRFVNGLRFTKTAPGGHHSASISIDAPERLFGDLGPADRVYIYDGRNARPVWDGYVENPGHVATLGGDRYELSAMGGVALASDNSTPVVFVSRDLSHGHWRKSGNIAAGTAGTEDLGPSGPSFKVQIPSGTPVALFDRVAMINTVCIDLNQPLHRLSMNVFDGKNSGDFKRYLAVYAPNDLIDPAGSVSPADLSMTPGPLSIAQNPGDPLFTVCAFGCVIESDVSGAVPDDVTWSTFYDIVFRPGLRDATGDYVIASVDDAVYAHEVVNHLVGSGILTVDTSTAAIETTSYQIQELAYLDGVKPHQILDDLSLYEPDFLWEVLESNQNGEHRFAYRAWPTTPRYEISGREFTETGGETDLSNRIIVNWTDAAGAARTTVRTSTVEALGSRVKDADPITLPEGQGSQANAERIGDEVLAALNTPTRSGTAVIREPIHDLLTRRMVMPWEIEPGYVVRVRDRGINLRLTEMTYDDADCSTSLTLGSPTLTLAQRIARLGK